MSSLVLFFLLDSVSDFLNQGDRPRESAVMIVRN